MRISDWSSDVCSSDLTPNGGGGRAFVHINAFQPGSRRPVDGDLVSYAVTRDGRGRSNASEVRFAGQRITQRKPARQPTRIPRLLLGSAALVTVVVGTAIGILPIVVAIACAGLSLLSYLLYWLRSEEHTSELQSLMHISYA